MFFSRKILKEKRGGKLWLKAIADASVVEALSRKSLSGELSEFIHLEQYN